METKILVADDPYAKVLERYFSTSFPSTFSITNTKDIMEVITQMLIGTKETRYGTLPAPEVAVNIRRIVTEAIEKKVPIPVLIPWGGKKTVDAMSVDVAEIAAIKNLVCLNEEIMKYFSPGLQMNIRIEDTGAKWLYKDKSYYDIGKYSDDFFHLTNMLKGANNINPIKESDLMDEAQYFKLSKMYSEMLLDYIIYSDQYPTHALEEARYIRLLQKGWIGEIPVQQRDYYRSRYKALYPNISDEEATRYLADYLGGAKARYDLKGRGEPESPVKGFVGLTYAHPVPGAPDSIFSTTLYKRTINASSGRTHIAPWRAKGFLSISGDVATTKITSWSDVDTIDNLERVKVSMTDGDREITFRSDYLLND